MEKFALIGGKLGHSYSPLIHANLGNYEYDLMEVPPEGVEEIVRNEDFRGFNVTIPYKKKVMEYCDECSSDSHRIGSVNTVVRDPASGRLLGYNTDYFGFRYLMEKNQIDAGGRKCLVLGSGGASLTVQAVLADLGASSVTVISRTGPDNYENLSRHQDAEIIVNTTPVGMYPNHFSSPVDLDSFPRLRGVVDLIYNPYRTQLILSALRRKIPCAGGLDMLVAQGWEASQLFQGKDLDPADIEELTDEIKEMTMNRILIGMPGSGKTMLGNKMAEKMGRQFLDIDDLIVVREKMTIPEIFASKGEDYFRDVETEVFREACSQRGVIIAAGGGIVKREVNHDIARQNGIVIWIKRDLDKLDRRGRPLSQSTPLEVIYEERKDAYESWSDYFIDNNQEMD